MNIAIVKYNAGNVQSVQYALARLGFSASVTDNHDALATADKVIFPGVGNANAAMKSLRENGLDQLIKSLSQPVLGICVGMQLLCSYSEENATECLGIIDLPVQRFIATSSNLKVPQMGWNTIANLSSALFQDVPENSFVYYVHSYYVGLGKETISTTNYIHSYSAAIQKDNFYGVQFHAEKSADVGDRILYNFLNL
jgi:imidazole glycerol-phosphate synthase subunit HisH